MSDFVSNNKSNKGVTHPKFSSKLTFIMFPILKSLSYFLYLFITDFMVWILVSTQVYLKSFSKLSIISLKSNRHIPISFFSSISFKPMTFPFSLYRFAPLASLIDDNSRVTPNPTVFSNSIQTLKPLNILHRFLQYAGRFASIPHIVRKANNGMIIA